MSQNWYQHLAPQRESLWLAWGPVLARFITGLAWSAERDVFQLCVIAAEAQYSLCFKIHFQIRQYTLLFRAIMQCRRCLCKISKECFGLKASLLEQFLSGQALINYINYWRGFHFWTIGYSNYRPPAILANWQKKLQSSRRFFKTKIENSIDVTWVENVASSRDLSDFKVFVYFRKFQVVCGNYLVSMLARAKTLWRQDLKLAPTIILVTLAVFV